MRILIEPSGHTLHSAGDVAMLQAVASRLGQLWPKASFQTFSGTPDLVRRYCRNIQPLAVAGRLAWGAGFLGGRLSEYLPGGLSAFALKLERQFRHRLPSIMELLLAVKLRLKGDRIDTLRVFLEAVSKAHLVVVAGMGGIADAFRNYALSLLETLDLAIRSGAFTAMVGQGVGPIRDPVLLGRAKAVLPRVDFIALREARASGPLLRSLGVAPDKTTVTGDDAIEVAYQLRSEELGTGLGVNLRMAKYAEVDWQDLQRVRQVLQEAARQHQAPMIPVPISQDREEADLDAIRHIIAGYGETPTAADLNSPRQVIKQIQRCRVVATGSYHAAVFALAQGIPVVCMANSAYYEDKFLGLADQFGGGCEVVVLRDRGLPANLTGAIEEAWRLAGQLRPRLLARAAQQTEQGHAAYRRIYELFKSRPGRGDTTLAETA
jgi:colanic acid/amylovoran biosynthesis protein